MEDKKSLLIMAGLVGLILLLSAGQSFLGTKPPLKTTANIASESGQPRVRGVSAVVEFNGTEFTPTTITIKQGQTVKFVNTGSTAMRIASNPHPTHIDYPELDQGKDVKQNGKNFYSFTFDKIGSWKFHNHQPLVQGGTVIVTK